MFFLISGALRGCKMLVALAALELGASAFFVGVLAALFAVLPMLFSVLAGRISDRIGFRTPLFLGGLGMALAALVPAVELSLVTLVLCPTLLGLAHIFTHVSVHNAVGSLSSSERRAGNFGTLMLGTSASAFVGPLCVGLSIDHLGHQVSFALMAITATVAALPAYLFRRPAKDGGEAKKEEVRPRTRELLSMPGLRNTFLISAVILTGIELFSFYMPIYGRAIGLSATSIGAVLACYGAAAIVIRLVVGRIVRRFGEFPVLTAAMLIAALGFLLIPFLAQAAPLLVVAFVLGLGLGVAGPLTIMLTWSHAPTGRSGEALGLRLTVNKATQIAIPLVFGGLGTLLGVAPVFLATAGILLLGGLLTHRSRG